MLQLLIPERFLRFSVRVRSRSCVEIRTSTTHHVRTCKSTNLSNGELIQLERDVLAKEFNFAVTPKQILVVDLITSTESAIRYNKLADTVENQLLLKVSVAHVNAKACYLHRNCS